MRASLRVGQASRVVHRVPTIPMRMTGISKHPHWWGRRCRLPSDHARIPPQIAAFPARPCPHLPHLALIRDVASSPRTGRLPDTWPRFRGSGSRPASLPGPAVVAGSTYRRPGCGVDPERSKPETLVRAGRVGGDAQSRTLADLAAGARAHDHTVVEVVDRAPGQRAVGADRPAVLAGRVVRSLGAQSPGEGKGRPVHRAESGIGWVGGIAGGVGMVQRGRAGGTACPTIGAATAATGQEACPTLGLHAL